MSDLPKSVSIKEEGPREGFQIEKGPIATDRKIELIDALSGTGLKQMQIVSFVDPRRVPGMADSEAVAAGYDRRPGVVYEGLWLNEKGLQRAIATGRLDIKGRILLSASEPFVQRNQNRSDADDIAMQHAQIRVYQKHGVKVKHGGIMAVFGCNFAGDIPVERVLDRVERLLAIAEEHGERIEAVSLADTMAWATPVAIKCVVGAVRERWPELHVSLHLHDTRGMGIANAYAGLEMGVAHFNSAVAGLGGCPFAGHAGAAGNVCTEDLVFLCEEAGISTGVDLDRLIAAARLAEDIVGHPLPGSVMKGGGLGRLREAARLAATA